VPTTADGVDGLLAMPNFGDIKVVFDATSATAHHANWAKLRDTGVRMLDLTPASIGPFCVPVVNLDEHLDAPNLNMVTCGGQATVPIVAAVAQSGIVSYAEIVSSISGCADQRFCASNAAYGIAECNVVEERGLQSTQGGLID
jgi:acetaldehyde dehydrogenase